MRRNWLSICLIDTDETDGGEENIQTNESATDAYRPNIYVTYTEGAPAFTDSPPNVTALNKPDNNSIATSTPVDFNFTVQDDQKLTNCSLWGNFSGAWELNTTIEAATNDSTQYNFTLSPPNGFYEWNVECYDNATTSQSDFADANFTVTVNVTSVMNITLLYPTENINVTNLEFFNFTVQVNCANADCGNVSVYLDPADPATEGHVAEGSIIEEAKTGSKTDFIALLILMSVFVIVSSAIALNMGIDIWHKSAMVLITAIFCFSLLYPLLFACNPRGFII